MHHKEKNNNIAGGPFYTAQDATFGLLFPFFIFFLKKHFRWSELYWSNKYMRNINHSVAFSHINFIGIYFIEWCISSHFRASIEKLLQEMDTSQLP